MTLGIISDLKELLDLKRYAQKSYYLSAKVAKSTQQHQSRLRGRGMDFAEVRNYQAGDELRHVDWRVTARTGQPHTKLYQEEKDRPVVVVVDFNQSMYFGTRVAFKSVVACRLAALIAWTVVMHGDQLGGFLYSAQEQQELLPRSRTKGILPFLNALSLFSQKDPQAISSFCNISKILVRLSRVVRPGSLIILISDFYNFDQEAKKYLQHLTMHNDVISYHICDPVELETPLPAIYPISDGKQRLLLDLRNKNNRKAYAQYWQEHMNKIKNQFKSCKINYSLLTAEFLQNYLLQGRSEQRLMIPFMGS